MKKLLTLLVASVVMLSLASCGNPQEKLAAGIGYESLGNNVKALKCYEKAVKSEDPEALCRLGDFLINVQDTLVLNDTARAIELWNAAAEMNSVKAFYKLGNGYLKGIGVDKDLDKALEYFEKGVEQEDIYCIIGAAETCYEKAFKNSNYWNTSFYKQARKYHKQLKWDEMNSEQRMLFRAMAYKSGTVD